MVFAFLFGLSMDYEVFILSRMREEYDAHRRYPDRGNPRGSAAPGAWSRARRYPFLSFAALLRAPGTTKCSPPALAAGILIDATLIRALLVPAVVSLFGRWNWILPSRPAHLLRVEPSLPPRAVATQGQGLSPLRCGLDRAPSRRPDPARPRASGPVRPDPLLVSVS